MEITRAKRPEQLPGVVELAAILNLSERSLRRHLSQLGISYRALVHRFRSDLAKEYLLTTNLDIKEISFLLGYTDTSHFSKSFKFWNKLTPKQYRISNLENK